MMDELTGLMRAIRKIKPIAEPNFALNETSLLSKGFDSLFEIIGIAGWIIGGFSILVGGFGIANIMFVSVKERTNIIGIQKSLGAKNYFILFQFLFEAVFLSLIGGLVGIGLVVLLTLIPQDALPLDNSSLCIDSSVTQVMHWWQDKQVFGPGHGLPTITVRARSRVATNDDDFDRHECESLIKRGACLHHCQATKRQ